MSFIPNGMPRSSYGVFDGADGYGAMPNKDDFKPQIYRVCPISYPMRKTTYNLLGRLFQRLRL